MIRPKSRPLFVRLSDEERQLLTKQAQRAGLTLSDTVRLLVRGILTARENEVSR